jgi:hypothetical protein
VLEMVTTFEEATGGLLLFIRHAVLLCTVHCDTCGCANTILHEQLATSHLTWLMGNIRKSSSPSYPCSCGCLGVVLPCLPGNR